MNVIENPFENGRFDRKIKDDPQTANFLIEPALEALKIPSYEILSSHFYSEELFSQEEPYLVLNIKTPEDLYYRVYVMFFNENVTPDDATFFIREMNQQFLPTLTLGTEKLPRIVFIIYSKQPLIAGSELPVANIGAMDILTGQFLSGSFFFFINDTYHDHNFDNFSQIFDEIQTKLTEY